ncbi:zinc finger matrin-type protein 4-like [Heptranchias perlo]|uniref:zinc finger matrin-type protein 4-like n=1 Tax=Heptranchias perlo TaxID=212740 RepID=UPI00355A73FC
MKSAGAVDQDLFTNSYCKVCSAQLISESQRVAHYESRKHASKVRLYYMLHPVDGGCPAKKLRSENGSDDGDVDKNKCCTLCNMSFTSAVVAQSHYQGKIHAKRRRLLLGEEPPLGTEPKQISSSPIPITNPSRQRRDSDRFCQLCNAWFNNPMMAQQHYDGKKHKKNAARADLLEQLGQTLDPGALRALKRSYTCSLCNVILNSIEQYHAHLQGSKHQTKIREWLHHRRRPVDPSSPCRLSARAIQLVPLPLPFPIALQIFSHAQELEPALSEEEEEEEDSDNKATPSLDLTLASTSFDTDTAHSEIPGTSA